MALTETTHEADATESPTLLNPEATPDAEEEELEFGDSIADAQRHADQIRSNYQKLLEDPLYLGAVQSATGTTARVRTRFSRASEILGQLEEGASDAE